MKKHIIVYVTTPNKKIALQIGKTCVQDKLVACINIIDKVISVYEWQGKLCEEKECILIMKSIQKKSLEIIKKVKELHTYSCPCIVTLPILDGNKNFLDWISQNCE